MVEGPFTKYYLDIGIFTMDESEKDISRNWPNQSDDGILIKTIKTSCSIYEFYGLFQSTPYLYIRHVYIIVVCILYDLL